MARGMSIHIGLNNIDVGYYGPGNELAGCINDARDMQTLAVGQGFQTTLMIDEQATSEAVIAAISGAANSLQGGDILLLTYSGHGSHIPDKNDDEPDGEDETWCLYDRMLLDDELYSLWAQFESGVRICVLSDSCHSGTVAKMVQTRELMSLPAFRDQFRNLYRKANGGTTARGVSRAAGPPPSKSDGGSKPPRMSAAPPPSYSTAPSYAATSSYEAAPVKEDPSSIKFRVLPAGAAAQAYAKSKSLYDSMQRVVGRNVKDTVTASVILISGCQDDQLSADGAGNGLFTEKLKETWGDGTFNGGYCAFHTAIRAKMPVSQRRTTSRSVRKTPCSKTETLHGHHRCGERTRVVYAVGDGTGVLVAQRPGTDIPGEPGPQQLFHLRDRNGRIAVRYRQCPRPAQRPELLRIVAGQPALLGHRIHASR